MKILRKVIDYKSQKFGNRVFSTMLTWKNCFTQYIEYMILK